MKALYLYFHMMLFASQNFRKLNLEIGRNLPLATFGSERIKHAPFLPNDWFNSTSTSIL